MPDDYRKLKDAIDEAFPDTTVLIDNSGKWKTLIVDVYDSDVTTKEVNIWLSTVENIRDIYGFGAHHVEINTETADDRLLVSVDSNNT